MIDVDHYGPPITASCPTLSFAGVPADVAVEEMVCLVAARQLAFATVH